MEYNSSVVRYEDFLTDDFRRIVGELNEDYRIHRKLWEFVRICQIAESHMDLKGAKVLGFGVGTEPLAAWFASKGAQVIATDLASSKWKEKDNQNSRSKFDLKYKGICDSNTFDANVQFMPVDMNRIPFELRGRQFDIVYSCGSLEHIGSKNNSLRFLINQLQCIAPGGIGIHTTEYAYDSMGYETDDLCIFSLSELRIFGSRIGEEGGKVRDADLRLGKTEQDCYVDRAPYDGKVHLKLFCGCNITPVCLIVENLRPVVEVMPRKKRILWVGDAVENTGFARCTHAVCDALHASNEYEVKVIGLNYWGDPHDYPYTIYPCVQPFKNAHNPFGTDRIDIIAREWESDAIVFLCDPWQIPAYLGCLSDDVKDSNRLIAWLAVDAKNQKAQPLNRLDHVITWTEFAVQELQAGGYNGNAGVVPLGVDPSVFYPVDEATRTSYREELVELGVPLDSFIVGVVGRNQYPRKRLDLTIEYFATWLKEYDISDAYLLLHCAPTGDRGYDILALANYYGVTGRLIALSTTFGNIGTDLPDVKLAKVYNMMDAYITTTQGEGWGLPAHEAMACGVPVIAPDWSGLGDWARNHAYLISCSSTATSAPMNGMTYTLGGIADRGLFVEEIHFAYQGFRGGRQGYRRTSEFARSLTWALTGQRFLQELDKCLSGSKVFEKSNVS